MRQRLADEGLVNEGDNKGYLIDFAELHRSHPLVTVLADHLIETALQGDSSITARCAVTETDAVQTVTTVYLLRLRHQLSYLRRLQPFQMMAEETVAVAAQGRSNPVWLSDANVAQLLQSTPTSNLPRELITREVQQSIDFAKANQSHLEQLAKARAQSLLEDHRRVRNASDDIGKYSVTPCLPVDVIGVYVLLPESL